MCYNARVSSGTFLFVAVVSAYLWTRNRGIDRALALMLGTVALMQLLEWGLWMAPGCGIINKVITAVIPLYLAAQPVALNWIVGETGAGWAGGYKTVAVIAAALMLPAELVQSVRNYGDCSYVNASGHLVWKHVFSSPLSQFVYYPAMLYSFATLKNSTFSMLYLFFATLSHQMMQATKGGAWPSLWCHFVNALAAFAVVRPGP